MDAYQDAEACRFVLPLAGGEAATVSYRLLDAGRVAFDHVYVPPSHRGSEASRRVLGYAFDQARRHGWRVRPTCPYIAGRYVPRHPEVQDIID
jgi:predicted GNAT family acetyltransferase